MEKDCVHYDEKTGTLTYNEWYFCDGMLYRRDCLSATDPNNVYNLIKRHGLVPEKFGIMHPLYAEFENKHKSELIDEILKLRETVQYYTQKFG